MNEMTTLHDEITIVNTTYEDAVNAPAGHTGVQWATDSFGIVSDEAAQHAREALDAFRCGCGLIVIPEEKNTQDYYHHCSDEGPACDVCMEDIAQTHRPCQDCAWDETMWESIMEDDRI